jgi:hypothetical protein
MYNYFKIERIIKIMSRMYVRYYSSFSRVEDGGG